MTYGCYAFLIVTTLVVAIFGDVIAFWPERSVGSVVPVNDDPEKAEKNGKAGKEDRSEGGGEG